MFDDTLLTTTQVLEFLQIGRTKLWALVRSGDVPAYRIGDGPNGALRYRRTDLVSWLENQRVVGSTAIKKQKSANNRGN